ncbi:MAG: hypothetical protein JWM97_3013 [Phycisphaerales bacterium]|nr:hypothetical protein [Phycisphaerales bacterium]
MWRVVPAFLLLLAASSFASAHPLSQGALDVTIHPDKVTVHARVTVEEVSITNSATTPGAPPGPWAATGLAAFEQHAAYLASHLHVTADGRPLPGGVVKVQPPDDSVPDLNQHAVYDLEYSLPAGAGKPAKIELRSDVLADGSFTPGSSWEATYVVRIECAARPPAEGLLLTGRNPIVFDCNAAASLTSAGNGSDGGRARLAQSYFLHGVHHILTGYDHLLFISALVLAATTLWDLVKVVTAFTLAHTLTLTLAALNLVHLPERVVEPLIAGSIVFVALQNVFWPRRSRGWGRLAAAFFFGLFHGLGFAGGLLDAMQAMQGGTILLAVAAFSIGVEAGHQLVVLPLFAALKLARHTRPDPIARDRLSMAAQRFGSAAISLAGLFYLFVALRLSFASV